jgi:PAP2 superfamily
VEVLEGSAATTDPPFPPPPPPLLPPRHPHILPRARCERRAGGHAQAWKEKYRWNFWRPVVGVRLANLDDYPATVAQPAWRMLGSPKTNTRSAAVTPSFPAYPSGHATVGTAALAVAREMLRLPPSFKFTVTSEEYDGVSTDEAGKKRPHIPKTMTVDEALLENDRSRVYLGVHWSMDCEEGKAVGHQVAHGIAAAFPALA